MREKFWKMDVWKYNLWEKEEGDKNVIVGIIIYIEVQDWNKYFNKWKKTC